MANKTLTLAEIEQLREKPGPKPKDLPLERLKELQEHGYGSRIMKRVLEREYGIKVSRTTIWRQLKSLEDLERLSARDARDAKPSRGPRSE
jgi:hypothetical protein